MKKKARAQRRTPKTTATKNNNRILLAAICDILEKVGIPMERNNDKLGMPTSAQSKESEFHWGFIKANTKRNGSLVCCVDFEDIYKFPMTEALPREFEHEIRKPFRWENELAADECESANPFEIVLELSSNLMNYALARDRAVTLAMNFRRNIEMDAARLTKAF